MKGKRTNIVEAKGFGGIARTLSLQEDIPLLSPQFFKKKKKKKKKSHFTKALLLEKRVIN
jgi:hypothetical protein